MSIRSVCAMMILIATSHVDLASTAILGHLLRTGSWETIGRFDGNPVYQRGERTIVTLQASALYRDHLDREVQRTRGEAPELIIYASRHRSESGRRSLTVHPIGNFGAATLGGEARRLVPTVPHWMTQALRLLMRKAEGLDYSVSFEATHHGPYLQTPAFYVEVGSDERAWTDAGATSVIADVLSEVQPAEYPVAVGLGGGHYVPRITDVALDRRVSFGHMIPSYALQNLSRSMLQQALQRSPGASLAYIHRKAIKGELRRRVTAMVESQGVRVVRQSDLEPLAPP